MCFPFVTGELEFQRRRSMVKVKQRTLRVPDVFVFLESPLAVFFTPFVPVPCGKVLFLTILTFRLAAVAVFVK